MNDEKPESGSPPVDQPAPSKTTEPTASAEPSKAPEKKVSSPLPLFIIDTNVLYDVFGTALGATDHANRNQSGPPLKMEHMLALGCICVPMTVLVEFLGKFFQTKIDLLDYEGWHQKRRVALNPLLSRLTSHRPDADLPAPGQMIIGKNRDERWVIDRLLMELLPAELRWLRDFSVRTRVTRPNDPKFMDGGDAMILAEAVSVASAFPDWNSILVTNDCAMSEAVGFLPQWYGRQKRGKPPAIRAVPTSRLANLFGKKR